MGELFLPIELKLAINKYFGLFNPNSIYANKILNDLFRCSENRDYLCNNIIKLITNTDYVSLYAGHMAATLVRGFSINLNKEEIIDDLMDMMPQLFHEDLFVNNAVLQLSKLNRDFLKTTSRNLVSNPKILIKDIFHHNLETGMDESNIEWDYNVFSYADGTWHPEYLFTNSKRNRENPYWMPLEVNFYTDWNKSGLSHRYFNKIYATSEKIIIQISHWQNVRTHHQYDYDTTESLVEGESADRRNQVPHGYNMVALA